MLNIYREAEGYMEKFVEENKPDELSVDEFLSMFVWYFDTEDDKFGIPKKMYFNVRLKTVDEIMEEIDEEIVKEELYRDVWNE